MNIQLPEFAQPLFEPYRYKVLRGGRGSAKSYSVARALLIKGANSKRKIFCGREFQNSISDSVLSLLEGQAQEIGLDKFYTFTNNSIMGENGTEFMFKGIRHNINSIKSIPGITDCWIEEAQTISKPSLDILIPTIREDGSEIIFTYNPEKEDDPVHAMFTGPDIPKDAYIADVNWDQNPWFPDVLREEKDRQYAINPELADHIWGGACRSQSDAQIFKGKYRVDFFEPLPHWQGPYYGADWGFSKDPTVLVQFWIDLTEQNLYVRRGVSSRKMLEEKKKLNPNAVFDLTQIGTLFDQIKGSRDKKIRADCSRPETISYVAGLGFNIEGAKKWQGSVEDGIEYIKSFRQVIIHPEAQEVAQEFKNYSYKVDRLTQDVTTDIIDDWNHYIDALRYGLEPLITRNVSLFDFM